MKEFLISPLSKTHNRKSFSCGIKALDTYLHKQAGQEIRKKVAVTYVLYDRNEKKVAGYYTLSANIIELIGLPDSIRKKLPLYSSLPATLIGRLAIDENYQKKGLGELMLVDAIKRAYHTSLEVASYAIIVDAINSNAKKFYRKYGFLDLSVSQNCLFLPMSSIEHL
ncbi:GNAT family N-acetyltransferase [Thiotrichales bacterium 19S9-12]|nr:GNAT family N-acetyltransferase [Thiotrichales bacterium 19S9-11]MCF6811668.1 GNAT family N-acetyltransferase [Thiotrichales bacterium 19S9-12]